MCIPSFQSKQYVSYLTVNVKKKNTKKLWSYNNVTLIAIHHSLTSKEI